MGVGRGPSRFRGLALGAVTALAAACGDAGTAPEDQTATLQVVSGSGQRGLEGEVLPLPIRVRVVDGAGRPVQGVAVLFEATGGGAPETSRGHTGANGLAETYWRLGPASSGAQRLTATLEGGRSPGVTVDASAVTLSQADRVVVHGALGPLRGVVALREAGTGLELVYERVTADTVIILPPLDTPGVDVVVFAPHNRPARATKAWGPGADTLHVTLEPPLSVDVEVTVRAGEIDVMRGVVDSHVAQMGWIWSSQGMGLVVGKVTVVDAIENGVDTSVSSTGLCTGTTPGDAIRVTYVTSIDGGRYDGWGCWSGHVWMSLHAYVYPNLLAHELGHTFTLGHTDTGLMYAANPGTHVWDGEVFRAHFHSSSALNTIFAGQPGSWRRSCVATLPCLPETYTLGQGLNPAPRLVAARLGGSPERHGRPLDGVGDEFEAPPVPRLRR